MRKSLLFVLLVPGAVLAADGPEAVYGKLHKATLAGNVDEVLSYATTARRKEIGSLPGREDMVRVMAMSMPRSYEVTRRDVDGAKAVLQVRGLHEERGPAAAKVLLFKEKGNWKVDEWGWEQLAQARPPQDVPPSEAVTKIPPIPKASNEAGSAQPVEPIPAVPVDAPTLRKTSAETTPCIIKPVMTDDDLRRCGATPPKYD
jgi:hypothetical protein